MKAIVYTEYGPPDVLQLKEVPKPAPQEGEVLIKIHATAITTGDVNARDFVFVPPGFGPLPRLMVGVRRPRKTILGTVFSGEIESMGPGVELFKVGDPVYGIDGNDMGACAEYKCMPEKGALAIKPANLNYEEAAAIPFGATTALHFLRDKGNIQSGDQVLVNGASGSVGTAAVQLAKVFGATVTGVCSSANIELVKSLGADQVIDYTQEDFTQTGETYDIILDAVAGKTSFSACKNSLKQNGRYLAVAGGLKEMVQMLWTSVIGDKKVIFGGGTACERKEYLVYLKGLVEEAKVTPIIDKCYPLEQTAEAHRYVDTGRKKGNVIITVGNS